MVILAGLQKMPHIDPSPTAPMIINGLKLVVQVSTLYPDIYLGAKFYGAILEVVAVPFSAC